MGNVGTQRSTSGLYSVIRGPNSSFPITVGSNRHTCVAHATPEAELVAADFGLRTDWLPSLSWWRVLFPHQPPLTCYDVNHAMLCVVTIGKHSRCVNYHVHIEYPRHGYMRCVRCKTCEWFRKSRAVCAPTSLRRRLRTPFFGNMGLI